MSFWKVPEMWSGGECWIIGGGLSMPRQFGVPEETIDDVLSGRSPITVYNDYLSDLFLKHVIGVNIAFLLGDWVSVLFFCDRQIYRGYRNLIRAFPNLKVTDCGNDSNLSTAKGIKRLKRDLSYGISTERDTIRWNENSGMAAINFAVHTGVKRINLLGFDLQPTDSKDHWHYGYQFYQKRVQTMRYKVWLKRYPRFAEEVKKVGIEVLNVNPDSALDVFPKVQLKDIL